MEHRFLRLPIDESPAFLVLGGRRSSCERQPSFWWSVRCALEGLREAYRTQRNLRIQCAIGVVACGLAVLLRLPLHELALIIALTALVLFAELMNTALELTLDQVTGTEFDPSVKRIKDIAAASVLVVSLGAAVLGMTVFLPHVKLSSTLWAALTSRWLTVCGALAIVGVLMTGRRLASRQRPTRALARGSVTILVAGTALLLAAVVVFSR